MRKGTFSVKKTNSNSAAHNSRKQAPKYLLGLETNGENYYELIQKDDDFIEEAQQIYKNKIGQKMQSKQIPNLVQETVITLTKNQDEKDVKKLFDKLHEKYGGHELIEISVHRDEGHFERDGIAYYSTKNILKKGDEYFIKSKPENKTFSVKVDISEFEKIYNFHAHAKFSMFDKKTGKTARMQKKDMSERIKFVSKELGLKFAPDVKTSRIKKSVNQVKDEYYEKSKEQEVQSYNFREMQKKITALEILNKEQKKELHKLNSEVRNEKVHEKQLEKISELEIKIKGMYDALSAFADELNCDRTAQDVYDAIKGLKTQKNSSFEEFVQKSEKTPYSQDMGRLRTENQELEQEKQEKQEKIESFFHGDEKDKAEQSKNIRRQRG